GAGGGGGGAGGGGGGAPPGGRSGPGGGGPPAAPAPRRVVCFTPRGIGGSAPAGAAPLEQMVDDIEAARRELGSAPWTFWGMSGGGWLAMIYAHRCPEGLAGIIVESACLCFRERLGHPRCALSPVFPARRALPPRPGPVR